MSVPEEKILVEHRESLLYLLTEAAEIEHGLMCCYLFAAYSLKRDELSSELFGAQRIAVDRWRSEILAIARDEMVHLALVSNLMVALGSAPHFARQNFPVSPGYHPAGVVVSLAPFDRATLDHFIYLERPEGSELPDGRGFTAGHYHRTQMAGRLVPSAQDFLTVGHLYRGIEDGIRALCAHCGEDRVFIGDPHLQIGSDVISLAGMRSVRTLADAVAALETIVRQGEGASGDSHASHYARFVAIRDEYATLLAADPKFAPARPVARNPVMRRPADEMVDRVWVCAEPAATLLDLANATYALMLRALGAMFSPIMLDADARDGVIDLAISAMHLIGPLAEKLTTLPASDQHPGVTAGLTFTMSRSIHPPFDRHALRLTAESARAIANGIDKTEGVPLDHASSSLRALAKKLDALSTRTDAPAAPPSPALAPVLAPPAASTAGADVEIVRGKSLAILFEVKRCIHSRHCVLEAPTVFLANTPGAWIHPDAASVETLVGVAHECPSGAVRYQRLDGGPEESAPPVNVARVRENGPIALLADISLESVANGGRMFRATLCRCGASQNKPYCDGSHARNGFVATGEPPLGNIDPLAVRDGALVITPRKNGPLTLSGNLEICAGTGHTIGRVTKTALCRCGASQNKPYCDGTHAKVNFTANGA